MNKRLHAFFSGKVQGVGFRFTVREVASSLGVAGWVKNLPGGRVELLAEGDAEQLRRLIAELKSSFRTHIREVEEEWSEPADEFSSFGVRF